MLALAIQRLPSGVPLGALAVLGLTPQVFWPYFAGFVVLAVGAARILVRPAAHRPAAHMGALDRILSFGPLLYAIPMAVYGAEHFTVARMVANIVPAWIPWHLFWAYFVGVALITAALAIAADRYGTLAIGMLGLMIFLFVLLLHLPAWIRTHNGMQLTLLLRDLTLACGGVAYAASRSERQFGGAARGVVTAARFLVASSVAIFAFDHFLYPTYPPGVPQEGPEAFAMPSWIPAHELWAYAAGAILLAASIGLMLRAQAKLGATMVGAVMLFSALFVYLPIMLAKPLSIESGLNYIVMHLAWAGAAFLLADAVPRTAPAEAMDASPAEAEIPGTRHQTPA
jgi:uncharacterized membrane protein